LTAFGTGEIRRKRKMLNQLIESNSDAPENRTRGRLLLTTFVMVFSLCLSAVTYSLFAKELGTGTQELEISTLVAPIAEEVPPAPVSKQEMPEPSNTVQSALPSRRTNTLRIEESPIAPKGVSTAPNTEKARPVGNFLTSDKVEGDGIQGARIGNSGTEGVSGIGTADSGGSEPSTEVLEKPKTPPAPPTRKPIEEIAQKPKTPPIISTGVVNGKAKFLPKPIYTAAAKSVRAAGAVSVQVLIDEAGDVVSAKAVDGHPLLRSEAEKAARSAKFSPTLLSKQAVKVSGIIVYKFSM